MRILACLLLGGLLGGAAAQEPAPCTPGVFAATTLLSGRVKPGGYSATIKTTFEQRLLDGNIIRGEYHTRSAQNSQGWTRQEFGSNCVRDAEGNYRQTLSVNITKSNPRETIHWMEGPLNNKEATITRPIQVTPEQRAAQLAKAREQQVLRPAPQSNRQQFRSESLGTETIAGLEAGGTRTVRTIPPGEEGNLLPLEVISETWRTKDGLVVRVVNDDPRRGKSVSEMEDVRMGEPDASLFAPPEGYTVKEMPQPAAAVVVAK